MYFFDYKTHFLPDFRATKSGVRLIIGASFGDEMGRFFHFLALEYRGAS